MKRIIWDVTKIILIFIICTFVFYFGLRLMHAEYEQLHRYHSPEGPAIKVFQEKNSFFDRLSTFFRLGE